jgi:hypothetical protein
MAAKDMLKIVRDETQRLEETSPQVPDVVIREFKKRFGDSTPEVTKPEITNGLDPIYVYPSDLDSPMVGGLKRQMSEMMLDPMYRSPRPSVLIPGDSVVTVKVPILNPLKTSTDDRIPDTLQTLSSARPLTSSEADSNHI